MTSVFLHGNAHPAVRLMDGRGAGESNLEFRYRVSYNLRKLTKRSTMHVTEGLLL